MNVRTIDRVKKTLVRAGSSFSEDLKQAYRDAIARETNENAKWVLESILENALIAEKQESPLCDDTGIPHLFIEVGNNRAITGELLNDIYIGVEQGLCAFPGRPMSINGTDIQRLDQSGKLNQDPAAVKPAPVILKTVDERDVLRLHVLLLGGGPAIRGMTYRVFHQHSLETIKEEIINRSIDAVRLLGCTPCTLAIGIGRSQYEATTLMMEAQVYGRHGVQTDLEREITNRVNLTNVGALGLGGDTSVLATFLKTGHQRASGVRIVSIRPCCCIEPRIKCVDL